MSNFKTETLLTTGIKSNGDLFKTSFTSYAFCERRNLVSLNLPDGCLAVYCEKNLLTTLKIPRSVREIWCNDNLLSELKIPNDVQLLRCENNPLKKLNLPSSLSYLRCDKELFDYDTCNIKRVDIYYEK